MGKNHKGVLVTRVERKSGYAVVHCAPSKDAELIANTIIEALIPFSHTVKTLTFDNGLEFAQHARVAKTLRAHIYFATPYRSWQRATNGNYNGLLRQSYPKKTCCKNLCKRRLARVERAINHRARKRLAYQTSFEVMQQSLKPSGVALVN